MPKKIGRDVIEKKAGGLINTPRESEEFQQWKEEREEEKEEKPKEQVEIKSKMPEEPEPSDDEINRQRAEEMALKEVFVNEHYRRKPKRIEDEEEEEE
jgi:hypothetical protein